jgi:hypothetical protein
MVAKWAGSVKILRFIKSCDSKPGEAEPISDVEAVSSRPVRRIRAAGEVIGTISQCLGSSRFPAA